jgi:hypothetical protein
VESLPIDAMGPRGRALHEFGRNTAETLNTDPDLGPVQRIHTAFIFGLELGAALQGADPEWARAAFEQLQSWHQQKHGDRDPQQERQTLVTRDVRVLRNLARQYGDA